MKKEKLYFDTNITDDEKYWIIVSNTTTNNK